MIKNFRNKKANWVGENISFVYSLNRIKQIQNSSKHTEITRNNQKYNSTFKIVEKNKLLTEYTYILLLRVQKSTPITFEK